MIKNYPLSKIQAVGLYEGTLREAIHLFKYEKKKSLAKPLGDLLIKHLEETCPRAGKEGGLEKIDFVIPVPLHSKKLREREFNQSGLLARLVGRHFRKPVLEGNLIRKKTTTPQFELDRKERLKNVKGAFAIKRREEVKGKNLLLIDDVRTTGATLKECHKVLRRAGAKEIHMLTLAV